MRPRAIKDLATLPDGEFFAEVSTGLGLIAEHTRGLDADTRALVERDSARGARILEAVAEEEAAKYLILMDAVRCPRKERAAHLGRYYSHLAKGVYAHACRRRPHDFAQLRRRIERERQAYYLDGPSGGDWVVRNEIMRAREDTLYVNYMECDGSRWWTRPDYLGLSAPYCTPAAVGLALALQDAGCSKPQALAIIARQWQVVTIADSLDCFALQATNRAVLQAMRDASLLEEQADDVYAMVVERWPFPLWSQPLTEINVDRIALEQKRYQLVDEGYE